MTEKHVIAVLLIVGILAGASFGLLLGYFDGVRDGQEKVYQEAERRGYVDAWNSPSGDTTYRWKEGIGDG